MKLLHVALAILLLACLLDLPYGYYQFVRWAATLGFGYLAYRYGQVGKNGLAVLFIGLVLLFQPFEKIALGRELWNIVDVIVGIGLFVMGLTAHSSKK